jgi:uncharacterized protein (TIGR02270 family)
MSLSEEDFLIELYREHLEESSFLYEQRLLLIDDKEVAWRDMDDFEQRLEAHIDALVLGSDLALEVCRQQAVEGNAGELHVAMRVFCRQEREDLFFETLEGIDPEDNGKQQAFIDTMKYELPDAWKESFISLLDSDDPQLCSIIATVAGYRRIPIGKLLVQALQRHASVQVIWALGRLREQGVASLLLAALGNEDEDVCSAASLALLRMGERQAVEHCLAAAGEKSWVRIPQAISSGSSAVPIILDMARSDQADPDTLLALGLLGESSAVEILLAKLAGDHAAPAVLALNLLTGAELYERVFIPEEVDEDELFPKELELYRQEGKIPTKPDGTPYGEWVTRLSQNPASWNEWWGLNRQRFAPGVRYRSGKPFSPASLLENMQHEKFPYRIRQLAYEEMVIRYDVNFPFEANLFVNEQLRILNDMANWVAANAGRFQNGAWYFAGRIIP